MKTVHNLVERLMQESGSANPKVVCYISKHIGVMEIMTIERGTTNPREGIGEKVIILMLAGSDMSVSL